MSILIPILFWSGFLLLIDASLGLIFEERWKKIAKGINIRLMALVEAGIAFLLIALHYILSGR
ncbi:MAG: hypothetical protein JXR40_12670 [Pontiellaceae bacterium]|nr:hypothetical protein [Pontiellaceae bacterium]